MGAQFTIPLVTVIPGQLIASALWNNEFINISTNFIPSGMDSYSNTDAQMQIQTAPYPGSVTSHASNLGGELERIRYQIWQILGGSNVTPPYWYAVPPTNLTLAAAIQIPIGGSILYPSAIPPSSNYLIKNGQAISRTTYATLFGLIGTTFGIGDGSTTFNIPNSTDRVPIAAGNLYALGATGGSPTHALTQAELPTSAINVVITDPGHNHSITDPSHSHGVTDPQHSHTERVSSNNTGVGSSVSDAGHSSSTNVSSSNSTANASTGLTVNSGSTGITGANANTTGLTGVANFGASTPMSILNPYLAEYWMIRVI